ncbi:MAG: hypothetical protein RR640_06890, partial [Oscillospiraceae bacterium]
MLIKSDKDFLSQLKIEDKNKMYLVMGSDEYLKNKCTNALIKKILPQSFVEFNAHYFDGQELVMDEVVNSIQTLPMCS